MNSRGFHDPHEGERENEAKEAEPCELPSPAEVRWCWVHGGRGRVIERTGAELAGGHEYPMTNLLPSPSQSLRAGWSGGSKQEDEV